MDDLSNTSITKVLVIGSANTDLVIKASHLPSPGETVIGGEFYSFQGGKGANQAVAAARMGCKVIFLCKLGEDSRGDEAIVTYNTEGINTKYCLIDSVSPTGVALITVDAKGENSIVVAPGANNHLLPDDILENIEAFDNVEYVLVQLEIPLETVNCIAQICQRKGKKLILNPAPGKTLSTELLRNCYMITPNQVELQLMCQDEMDDMDDILDACENLHARGAARILVTLGSKGIYYSDENESYSIPAIHVDAIDTTAAGDVFNGALTAFLAAGFSIKKSIKRAIQAAGIAVSRMGAQDSAPYLSEIEADE